MHGNQGVHLGLQQFKEEVNLGGLPALIQSDRCTWLLKGGTDDFL